MSSITESKLVQFTQKAVELLQSKGYKEIKADLPDFQTTYTFYRKKF